MTMPESNRDPDLCTRCDNRAMIDGLCIAHFAQSRASQPVAQRACSQPDCNRPINARGLCIHHYQKWRRSQISEEFGFCKKPDCTAVKFARGLCERHYSEWRRKEPAIEHPICNKCDQPAVARGYCQRHYMAAQRNGEVSKKTCADPTCDKPAWCKGLCVAHYQRARSNYSERQAVKERMLSEHCLLCEQPATICGFCKSHYGKIRYYQAKELNDEQKLEWEANGLCRECGWMVHAKGLCRVHYMRAYKERK